EMMLAGARTTLIASCDGLRHLIDSFNQKAAFSTGGKRPHHTKNGSESFTIPGQIARFLNPNCSQSSDAAQNPDKVRPGSFIALESTLRRVCSRSVKLR